MSGALFNLYKFANDYFDDYSWDANEHKGKEYARLTYSRILKYVEGCLILRKNSASEESQAPIMRSLIEASVDLQLIRIYPEVYPLLMDLASLHEARSFVKNYESVVSEETEEGSLNDEEKRSVEHEYYSLLERVQGISEFNIEPTIKKYTTAFKFALLKNHDENEKRHKKYVAFFDVLCGHAHNNLHFIYKDSVKDLMDIQRNIVHYDDLIASILKNGLINVVNIFEDRMRGKEFEKLKKLKKEIKKPSSDINSLFDGLYRISLRPEYSYLRNNDDYTDEN